MTHGHNRPIAIGDQPPRFRGERQSGFRFILWDQRKRQFIFSRGKHAGSPIQKAPIGYRRFLAENVDLPQSEISVILDPEAHIPTTAPRSRKGDESSGLAGSG